MNVREPRIIGTPKGTNTCMTDPTQCQDPNVVYLAWGTQVNSVGPFDDPAADLGIYITASIDGGETLASPPASPWSRACSTRPRSSPSSRRSIPAPMAPAFTRSGTRATPRPA